MCYPSQQHVNVEREIRCVQDESRARWSKSLDSEDEMRGRMPKIEELTYNQARIPTGID